jgi:hypothetical protein
LALAQIFPLLRWRARQTVSPHDEAILNRRTERTENGNRRSPLPLSNWPGLFKRLALCGRSRLRVMCRQPLAIRVGFRAPHPRNRPRRGSDFLCNDFLLRLSTPFDSVTPCLVSTKSDYPSPARRSVRAIAQKAMSRQF